MNCRRLPRSFSEAQTVLGKRESRKIANNTVLHTWGCAIAVKLHRTDVVTFYPDGRVVLHTGGWNTITTRSRFRACGFTVWSGERSGSANVLHHAGQDYYFGNTVEILNDGTVEGSVPPRPQPRRRPVRAGQFPRPVVSKCHDLAGADDALVPAEIAAEDESRWAEYNRKFNALLGAR